MSRESGQYKRVASPIYWFGGKRYLINKLLPLIPEHRTYVEVFGGAAWLLLSKPPSPVEVYNDIDSRLVNLFRVLRDPEKFAEFQRLAALTPYSREEWEWCYYHQDEGDDDVEQAWHFFVVIRQSFAGKGGDWGYNVRDSSRGMSGVVSAYLSSIERLPEVHARFMRVQIEHDDFRNLIRRYDSPETFFYLDPPYVPTTRRGGGYRHEMSHEDHEDLVRLLLGIQGKALLSGYDNPIYKALEDAGWKRLNFEAVCHAAGRTRQSGLQGEGKVLATQKRVESVWFNYEPPTPQS